MAAIVRGVWISPMMRFWCGSYEAPRFLVASLTQRYKCQWRLERHLVKSAEGERDDDGDGERERRKPSRTTQKCVEHVRRPETKRDLSCTLLTFRAGL